MSEEVKTLIRLENKDLVCRWNQGPYDNEARWCIEVCLTEEESKLLSSLGTNIHGWDEDRLNLRIRKGREFVPPTVSVDVMVELFKWKFVSSKSGKTLSGIVCYLDSSEQAKEASSNGHSD